MYKSIITIALILVCRLASGQLVIDDTYTPEDLVDVIVGDGIFVTNINLSCPQGASAWFDGSASNIGISDGVLLTTGLASSAVGPNNDPGNGICNNGQADPDLEAVAGTNVYDGCILQFDMVPTCTPLTLNYVFASEEYPEYINREFVDAMVIVISGPGIPGGSQNVALVPGTSTPVNISTINSNTNSNYYVANNGGASIQYDGFTTVLTASVDIQPCQQYRIKIGVADAADCIFDGGLFIQENSMDCGVNNAVTTDISFSPLNPVEGCRDYEIELCRQGSIASAYDLELTIGGTATNGVDYPLIPSTITFPAGVQCTTLVITPPQDNIAEGEEIIEFVYQAISGSCQVLDTVLIPITDEPHLLPDFYNNDVCLGNTMFFNNTTTIDPPSTVTDFIWVFGDGDSSLSYNATHLYQTPNTYDVKLIATSNTGCVDSITQQVNVYDYPTASFTLSGDVCLGTPVSFTNTSTDPSNDVIGTVQWNFGDGIPESTWDAIHYYSIPDTFPVVLTVYSDVLGCSDSYRDTVIVNPSVTAGFIAPNVCFGNTVNFVNQSSGSATWVWDYGDASPLDTAYNTTHDYLFPDTFNVSLIGIVEGGCNDTMTREVFVFDAPQASFTVEDVCFLTPAIFENTSIPPMMGDIGSWQWLFSDQTSSSAYNTTHYFPNPNSYQATLITYSSNLSCSDTAYGNVTIHPIPDASFSVQNVCHGTPVAPINNTTGIVSQWEWDFGDSTAISTNMNPNHTYDTTGVYEIELTATNAFQCSDSATQQVTVFSLPVAQFSVNSACAEVPVPFLNQSSIAFPENIVQWIWNYDDGPGWDTVINANYTYPIGGDYNPQLIVVSAHGCRDSITIPLTVYYAPTVDIDLDTTFGCSPLCVELTDLSSISGDSIVQWQWNFGDLILSSQQNNSHCYGTENIYDPQFYDISLKVVSDKGCPATKIFDKAVEVYPVPEAEFDWDPKPVSMFDPEVQFIDQALGASSWHWDFGQPNVIGDTSLLSNPMYTYTIHGYFPVTQIVGNAYGCFDTLVETLHVDPDFVLYVPNAFTPDGDGTNDEWGPKGAGVKKIDIRVFDRWGKMVFFSADLRDQWDGKMKDGDDAIQGTYVYHIEAETLAKEVFNYSGRLVLYRNENR